MKVDFYPLKQYMTADDLPVKVVLWEQNYFCMHYHDYVELVFVLSGYGEHICEKNHYHVSRGDIFVIKPGIVHGYTNSHDLFIANVLINISSNEIVLNDLRQNTGFYALFEVEPLLRLRKRNFPHFRLSEEDLNTACRYFKEIEKETEQKASGFRFAAMSAFYRLLLLISRRYGHPHEKQSENMMRLSRMIQFIDKNYMYDITKDEIVHAACISSCSGSRIFKAMLNKTVIEYLVQVRINHAVEKIQRGEKISTVAFQCGFRDSNYFSTVFRKLIGKSPSEYQKQSSENKI